MTIELVERCLFTASSLFLLSCSTVNRESDRRACTSDDDCDAGLICALDQGGVCAPPLIDGIKWLGFAMSTSDGALNGEIRACDDGWVLENRNKRTLEIFKNDLAFSDNSDEFSLRSTLLRPTTSCQECENLGFACEESEREGRVLTACRVPVASNLLVTQPSRFSSSQLRIQDLRYSLSDESQNAGPPASFRWLDYTRAGALTANRDPLERPVVLEVKPDEMLAEDDPSERPQQPPIYRLVHRDFWVASDEEPSLAFDIDESCQRELSGEVQTFGGEKIEGAQIRFFYEDGFTASSTISREDRPENLPACKKDDGNQNELEPDTPESSEQNDCPSGWTCDNQTQRCGLDLSGLPAHSQNANTNSSGAFSNVLVHSYCEHRTPETLPLRAVVTPPPGSPYPAISFRVDQKLKPYVEHDELDGSEDFVPRVQIGRAFCLPNWAPSKEVAVSVGSAPIQTPDGRLCCDTSCFANPENQSQIQSGSQCTDYDSIRFELDYTQITDGESGASDCLPPVKIPDSVIVPRPDDNGVPEEDRDQRDVVGRYTRACLSNEEEDSGNCFVELTPGAVTASGPALYRAVLLQNRNSLFRSQLFERMVDNETESVDFFEFSPRTMLRGTIACFDGADDGRCFSGRASILAERISKTAYETATDSKVDGNDYDILPPFFYEGVADDEGNFSLPVNPGFYVVTAFPAEGVPGGPAGFFLFDLRANDNDQLDPRLPGHAPTMNIRDQIRLERGVTVLVDPSGFQEQRTPELFPLDLGSWTSDGEDSDLPTYPDLDLNDPTTCYHESSAIRGCLIRRLRASSIQPLSEGRIQFTARNRSPKGCAESDFR